MASCFFGAVPAAAATARPLEKSRVEGLNPSAARLPFSHWFKWNVLDSKQADCADRKAPTVGYFNEWFMDLYHRIILQCR